jgi:hypothetical protein
MTRQEKHYFGRQPLISDSNNPELQERMQKFNEIDKERASIALLAARHIIENLNGETSDLGLFFTAMYGKDPIQASEEDDVKIILPNTFMHEVSQENRVNAPIIVRDLHLPDANATVGLISSFLKDRFQPVKFKVYWGELDNPDSNSRFWRGEMSVAIKEVVPNIGKYGDYELEDSTVELFRSFASVSQDEPKLVLSGYLDEHVYNPSDTRATDFWETGLKVFHHMDEKSVMGWNVKWLANQFGITCPHLSAEQVWSPTY